MTLPDPRRIQIPLGGRFPSAGGGIWTNLSDGGSYGGTATLTLLVGNVTPIMDGDLFRCVVTNSVGKVGSAAASLVVIGLLLALAVAAPTSVGVAIIAAFAVFHGHAHGTEAEGAAWVPFMAGFVGATAVLHAVGIGMAAALMRVLTALPVRLIGAATAMAGVALLVK